MKSTAAYAPAVHIRLAAPLSVIGFLLVGAAAAAPSSAVTPVGVAVTWDWEWENTLAMTGTGGLSVLGGPEILGQALATGVTLSGAGTKYCDGTIVASGSGVWTYTFLFVAGTGATAGSTSTATFSWGPLGFTGTYGGGPSLPLGYDVTLGAPANMTGSLSFSGNTAANAAALSVEVDGPGVGHYKVTSGTCSEWGGATLVTLKIFEIAPNLAVGRFVADTNEEYVYFENWDGEDERYVQVSLLEPDMHASTYVVGRESFEASRTPLDWVGGP